MNIPHHLLTAWPGIFSIIGIGPEMSECVTEMYPVTAGMDGVFAYEMELHHSYSVNLSNVIGWYSNFKRCWLTAFQNPLMHQQSKPMDSLYSEAQ